MVGESSGGWIVVIQHEKAPGTHSRLLHIDAIHTAVILRAPYVLPHIECGSGEGVVRSNRDLAQVDPFRSVHQIALEHSHPVFTTCCLDRTVAVDTRGRN